MTPIEVYTVTPADIAVVFVATVVLVLVAVAATVWAVRGHQPDPAPDRDGLEVVEQAMVRSRRASRRHHVPAHTRRYATGRARVYEGPTVDLATVTRGGGDA